MNADKAKDVDEYIAAFPVNVQEMMEQVRAAIKKAVPQVKEVISYGMPGFKVNKVLVYFAGYAKHIGFYPGAAAIEAFKEGIARYKWAKGSVQFPLDEPMPLDLIARITEFRLEEDTRVKK
jgi:uncharacterized protein YdhG (YjbR/CyaY superfamily)